ncbi:MAG: metallophosphoesterase [Clostridia bacterium]|nr:metallophosphoesterase [Clostridia bacterium]
MLKFLVFADLHYKKGMYASPVSSVHAILDRAAAENVDFVIHCGDFCNDYAGSPEITDAYLANRRNLPVYGIYGNHELETAGNTMSVVTPKLCNREVTFAWEGAGCWHTDIREYRIIGLDTNYSMTVAEAWEHNRPASWGPPAENYYGNSLGDAQLAWLEKLLNDAAENGKICVVFSHAALSSKWSASPDGPIVQSLFRRVNQKKPGTVALAVNGHLHTDHFAVEDGVAYFDVNTVHNGFWSPRKEFHYADSHTFAFTAYENGVPEETSDRPLNTLTQAKNTWFFTDPLSAVVTLGENSGNIDGAVTSWMHGIEPDTEADGVKREITSRAWIVRW